MQRNPWLNILVVLLSIIAALYLAQMLWQLIGQFADIILLFVLAWLVAFILAPLVDRINGKELPPGLVRLGGRVLAGRFVDRLNRFRFSRLEAVAIVYAGLVLVLFEAMSAFVPPMLVQLNQLVALFPEFANRAPEIASVVQRSLSDIGLRNLNVESALLAALGSLQNIATPVLQNAIVILGGVLTLIGNLLVILILSFFFALDGPRIFRTMFEVVPESFDTEMRMLVVTVDRTFGGFIRAQFLQALLVGVGTALVLAAFGGQYVLVASLFAALLMLIPFLGPALSLIPPFVVTAILDPSQLPIILGILLVYQLLIVNVVMPKLLSDALGMHPLVVIASLLIGIKIWGLWGAFFGIPVAGVLSTMALYLYRHWKRQIGELASAASISGVSAAPRASAAPPPTLSQPAPTAPPARAREKKQVLEDK